MTSYELAMMVGGFIAVLSDMRIAAIALVAVVVLRQLWAGVLVAATLGAIVLFMSQMKMAPLLNIPDPGAAKFAMNFVYSGLVGAIFALIKFAVLKARASKEAKE
jgi:hypothetical protein